MTGKPTVSELGIDLAAQVWQRSGRRDGSIEIAFVRTGEPSAASAQSALPDAPSSAPPNEPSPGRSAPAAATEWVLMRVAGDPNQRVLVFDRNEWECFVDGARSGEFDDAARKP